MYTSALDMINNLIANGSTLLGAGCYSAVFALNDASVLKIGITLEDPFFRYISDARIKSNRYAPRVLSITPYYKYDYYIAELEQLDTLDLSAFLHQKRAIAAFLKEESNNLPTSVSRSELTNLREVLLDIIDRDTNIRLDLHQGNFMQRGSTLIVNDPLCHEDMSSFDEIMFMLESCVESSNNYPVYSRMQTEQRESMCWV